MGRKAVLRSSVVIALVFGSLSLIGTDAVAQEITDNDGGLTVTPARGPIGTTVTLRGNGCSVLAFIGGGVGGAIEGADPLPVVDLDADEDFEVTYKIPAALEPVMGQGGGRPQPGTYFFRSFPPRCYARFVVTGLAATGPARVPLAGLALLGALLAATGTVMVTSGHAGRAEPPPAP